MGADKWPTDAPTAPDAPAKLFDVTSIIGSVYAGGDVTPRVAAFMLIANHSANGGEFTFPADGKTVYVSVSEPQERN